MKNVRERLEVLFGDAAVFDITSRPGRIVMKPGLSWPHEDGSANCVRVTFTAGYSADGKYSHYFVSQVPLKVGDFVLPPGEYLLGWVRGQDSLQVTFYLAKSGEAVGHVEATRNMSITRVESFRIWPPADKSLVQLGRFTFGYALAQN